MRRAGPTRKAQSAIFRATDVERRRVATATHGVAADLARPARSTPVCAGRDTRLVACASIASRTKISESA
ncbi:hypothetical protein DF010_12145 [Burkholderia cenocepacia]|nr:hypothetical protein DF010_12145 [Burkholderia cenocepacia]